jgi:RNA polymerase sigma-70 factor (ECF subfamily)
MMDRQLDFEAIYQQFRGPLKSFIAKRIQDETSAEDLVHDVFLKIHDQIKSLKDQDKLPAWIYQIARNSIIDSYRKKQQMVDITDPILELEQSEMVQTPEDLNRVVQSMIEKLSPQDKEAHILSDFQGINQAEIARRLGISLSGAKSRVQRARKKLKELLLECCHFEFDRYGTVFDYRPKNCTKCCESETCR